MSGKSDTSHTHAWDKITGKPTTFTPSSHTHDDRYYTETEMDTKLSGKQDSLGFTPVRQRSTSKADISMEYDAGLYAFIGDTSYGILLGNWMLQRRRCTQNYRIPDPGTAVYLAFTYSFQEMERAFGVISFGAGDAYVYCTDVYACNEKIGMNVCNMGTNRNIYLEAYIEFLTYAP